ncbi:hypothetical protein [Cytobacillus gottheilii]|uniref:hypothetical protein n=1 Tax=Cytobacillus gottheilii TaxID=859144 RepID=UPI0009BAF578|nr:hypothetical protein [Cytobacillus gottheilii]
MISFILAAISLIVIIPLVFYLPLGLTKKGKVMMTVLSFSFALLGIAAQSVMELWKLLLLLLLLVVMSGYLMMKRSEQFLSAEAAADTSYSFYSQENQQEYAQQETEEVLSPIKEDEYPAENIEDDVLEVLETESTLPVSDVLLPLATESEVEAEPETETEEAQLDEIDFEQIRLTEIAEDNEPLSLIEQEPSIQSAGPELSYIGELESLMSDENPVKPVEQVVQEETPIQIEENEFSLGLPLEDDDYIIPAVVENETSLSVEEVQASTELESDLVEDDSLAEPSLEERLEDIDVSLEEMNEQQDLEVIDFEKEEESLPAETEEKAVIEKDEILLGFEETTEEEPVLEEDGAEPWLEAATSSDSSEEQQEQEENSTLQREMLKTLLEQLQLAKETTEPHIYEKWIQQCMQQKMPPKEHYIFASLLIEHYIAQQENQKLVTLLNGLKNQYADMPIISEQIQFLLLSYSNKEQ